MAEAAEQSSVYSYPSQPALPTAVKVKAEVTCTGRPTFADPRTGTASINLLSTNVNANAKYNAAGVAVRKLN